METDNTAKGDNTNGCVVTDDGNCEGNMLDGRSRCHLLKRSESLRTRRLGRIAVPTITVQGADDSNVEPKCVSKFTKSHSLDEGMEESFKPGLEFNIVVSPKKLVSLSKTTFGKNLKKAEMLTSVKINGVGISHLDEVDGTKNQMMKDVDSDQENVPNGRKVMLDLADKLPERRTSVPRARKTSAQSIAPVRRLSPVPKRVPDAAERKQSLTNLMDSGKKRRDSVAALPSAKSFIPPSTKHRRLSLAPTPSIPRRRSSVKDTLSSYVGPSGKDGHTKRVRELLTNNGLPFGLDQEELKNIQIVKDQIDVSIPIFNVTETKICFTDIKTIEDAIRHLRPDVTVLKSPPTNDDGKGKNDHHGALPMQDKPDKMHEKMPGMGLAAITEAEPSTTRDEATHSNSPDNMLDKIPGQGLTVITEDQPKRSRKDSTNDELNTNERKFSIRTCVKRMREDTEDYERQLLGCKSVGTYASMETLHVLLSKQDAIRCVLEAMNTFPDKAELQFSACASLLQMASASEANCYIIQQNQGIPVLLTVMKSYSENVRLIRILLNIIGYISSSDELSVQLLQYGCHSQVLGAMSQHADDNSIIKQCLFILGNLVTTVETAKQIMLVGGVHTVIDMMETFPDDVDILENGCRALGSFAAYDDTCLDVGQAGGTRSVLDAMTSSPDNVCVLECGCWALACLSTMADSCEEMHQLDGVYALLATLEEHPEEESLQEYGVRTICNLAALETTIQSVSTERVLSILQRLMSQFSDNVELQGQVMFALSQIAMCGDEMQHCILRKGGVRSVVTIMDVHPEDIAIQEHGCRILGNLAVNETIRRQTEEEGASRVVIAAMLALDTCEDIQEYGCMALMNLTADIKVNKIRVKNNGGVLALLSSLKNFDSRPNIILSSLKTLGNIVELDEVCRLVMDERGLRTVVDIARGHSVDHDIQVFAAMVLCGLSRLKNLSTEEVEMIDRTMTRMLSLPSLDADITLFVCQTFENLLNTERGMHVFMSGKRLDVILTTMQKFSAHPEILQCGCKIIAVVALDVRHEMTTDAVRSVLHAMKTYSDSKDLQIVGCGALSCISENNGSLAAFVLENDGVLRISDALDLHPGEDRLHAVALMALANLSPVESSRNPALFHTIQDLVYGAMARFPENLEIQICACSAIAQCNPTAGNKSSEFLEALKYTMRRHGGKEEIHIPLAKALKCFWRGGQKGVITKILDTNPVFQNVFTAELQEAEVVCVR
ncbi:uncharacterized protein LOC124149956 isoform X1 [Haliotis rufescens]|uniref:uncharacterized protein LOC124149956 isoform X1 n=2 Tax=Haliotis rufescens TaxID=6454 RepID=UPI00201F5F82|nr:uncharacterized protein LOC124149956 isoform X1 [Haliotis rufescens]